MTTESEDKATYKMDGGADKQTKKHVNKETCLRYPLQLQAGKEINAARARQARIARVFAYVCFFVGGCKSPRTN